jgi:hypothetical protein
MGLQDAFGVSIPQGAGYDIGLAEYSLAIPDPAAARALALRSQPESWRLQFAGAPGRSYRVEASIDWRTWVRAGHASESSAGVFEFTDHPTAVAARFYRVVARGLPGF